MSESTQTPRIEDRSVSSSVEVAVDPDTAFTAFTEELDLWWVRGPINHHAAGRVLAMRCEPGVGGRLLEVYDDATGEALELARITAWEPGKSLAWRSSIDDVETEVRFEASDSGTTVTVVARIPRRWQRSWGDVVGSGRAELVRRLVRETRQRGARGARPGSSRSRRLLPRAGCRGQVARAGVRLRGHQSPARGHGPVPEGEEGHRWIEFRLGDSSLMVFKLDATAVPYRRRRTSPGSTSTTSRSTIGDPRPTAQRSSRSSTARGDCPSTWSMTSRAIAGHSPRPARPCAERYSVAAGSRPGRIVNGAGVVAHGQAGHDQGRYCLHRRR